MVKAVTATVEAGVGKYVSVNAPSVPGYRFVMWICAVSNGWVGHVYIPAPTSAGQNVWNNSSRGGAVTAYALYVPIA